MTRRLFMAGTVVLALTGGAMAQGMVPLAEYAAKGMPLTKQLLAKRCAALTSLLATASLKKSGSVSREYAKWSAPAEYFQSVVAKQIKGTDETAQVAALYVKQLARMYQGEPKVASRDQKNCLAAYQRSN